MEQAVGEGAGEKVHDFAGILAGRQHATCLFGRLCAYRFGFLAQLSDGGDGVERFQLQLECRDFGCDQLVGVARGFATRFQVLVHDVLQIVDREQIHVFELGDARLDVAGHGDVDHEHRLALAGA